MGAILAFSPGLDKMKHTGLNLGRILCEQDHRVLFFRGVGLLFPLHV